MTVAAQYAAEALDLPIESIRVRGNPDTDLSPYDWQTVASRQTWATGNAVLRARRDQAAALRHGRRGARRAPPRRSPCRTGRSSDHAASGRSSRSPGWSWATSSPTATPSAARWRRPPSYSRGAPLPGPRDQPEREAGRQVDLRRPGGGGRRGPRDRAVPSRTGRGLLRRRQGRQPGDDPGTDLRRHRAGAGHRDDGGADPRRSPDARERLAHGLQDPHPPTTCRGPRHYVETPRTTARSAPGASASTP